MESLRTLPHALTRCPLVTPFHINIATWLPLLFSHLPVSQA
jgi:hypothetical protein